MITLTTKQTIFGFDITPRAELWQDIELLKADAEDQTEQADNLRQENIVLRRSLDTALREKNDITAQLQASIDAEFSALADLQAAQVEIATLTKEVKRLKTKYNHRNAKGRFAKREQTPENK